MITKMLLCSKASRSFGLVGSEMATGYSSIPSFGLTENKKDLQFKTLENLNETNEIITEDISQRIFYNDAHYLYVG